MIWLLALACGPSEYDIDAWQSPLARGFRGDPDPALGEQLYHEETWLDDTPYSLRCISCHGNSPDDTLTTDADDLNRAAHTTWNAPWREVWKVDHAWDADRDDDVLGAYGGQVCVRAYYPEGSEMDAEQAAHLEAYMKTLRDEAPADGDDRAEPLDFGFTRWETQDAFMAAVDDGAGGTLRGEALGDVVAGEVLAQRHCGACHTPVEGEGVVIYTGAASPLPLLVARVRRVTVGDVAPPNDRMPRIPADRLSDEDLRDLLAWVTMAPG